MNIRMKSLVNYFFQGALITVPIVATIFILFKSIFWIDSLLPFHIPIKLPWLGEVEVPGLGILTLLVSVTVLGYVVSRFLQKPVVNYVEGFFERTPLVKIIYSSVKDLVEAFVGEKKRFNQPVLVLVDKEAQVQRIGFVTENDLSHLGLGADKVAVYLPFSYGFNGQLLIVPVVNVSRIDASGTDMMKFVISGGVTEVQSHSA